MNFKQSFVVAVAFFAVAVTASDLQLYQHESNKGLLSFISRSNNMMQRNPAKSLECFNYFIPLLNKLAQEYEANYALCYNTSAAACIQAEADTLDQRNDIASRTQASCDLLNNCKNSLTVKEEFECYINGSAANAVTMYGISTDASDGLAELSENIRLIKNREHKCYDETKRAYEIKSAACYNEFQNCISGKSEVPTPAPSTVQPTTEQPSTEQPTTEQPSTEQPSTEQPSTEQPSTEQPSTEKPSTEQPSTEQPSTEEPSTEQPSTEQPSTEQPSTEQPSTEQPSTEQPSTEQPSTEQPSTEQPSTEQPSTEQPSTEQPSTEQSSTEQPSTKVTTETVSSEDHTAESVGEPLPEEDIYMLRAIKNLKNHLKHNRV